MAGVIETRGLVRHYGRRRGIEAIDLAVPEGSLFGFLGPNGAGKTTAIRVLVGLLRPQRGEARVFGRDAWRESRAIKAEVGYVPGDLRLYGWLTGATALALSQKIRRRNLVAHGRELAEQFDLDLSVRVRSMSRGMRQKLGLIMGLAHRPGLLILDEPTTALDPLMQRLLEEHLRRLAADGHTVFFSSHTLSEVEALCQRVAIIREGRIVADESLAALAARAGRRVTIRLRAGHSEALPEPPPGLEIESRRHAIWHGTFRGQLGELVAWLDRLPLDDLEIGHADLETLFRRYYDRASES